MSVYNFLNSTSLGGGKPGTQPPGGLLGGGAGPTGGSGMEGGQVRGMDRFILRKAFGNSVRSWGTEGLGKGQSQIFSKNKMSGPFRAAYSAGDVLQSITGGGYPANPKYGPVSNQVTGGTGPVWIKSIGDAVNNGKATYTGNPKYVYDSSDFIKYKKLRAKLRNYNDSSFGGATNSAFTALGRVR